MPLRLRRACCARGNAGNAGSSSSQLLFLLQRAGRPHSVYLKRSAAQKEEAPLYYTVSHVVIIVACTLAASAGGHAGMLACCGACTGDADYRVATLWLMSRTTLLSGTVYLPMRCVHIRSTSPSPCGPMWAHVGPVCVPLMEACCSCLPVPLVATHVQMCFTNP